MDDLIDTFAAYRLLSLDNDPGTRTPTVEVAHEAMLREWERLRAWLNESRDEIRLQRQLATGAGEWQQANRESSFLLHGTRLEQFKCWSAETRLALTPAERDYLNASVQEAERQAAVESARQERESRLERRSALFLRGLVAVLLLATLGALGLTGFAFSERQTAQNERDTAQELALVNGAQAAFANGNTDLAIALALEANRVTQPSPQAQLMLSQAAYAPGTIRRFVGHQYPIASVAFSPDGRSFVSISGDKTVIVWDVASGQPIRRLEVPSASGESIILTPDRHAALAGYVDGSLILWRIDCADELTAWVEANRYIPELTCDQRALYRLEPACNSDGVFPTRTPYTASGAANS